MIGRSFATEDAHDKIRAAVVDLFEVLELEAEANIEEVTILCFPEAKDAWLFHLLGHLTSALSDRPMIVLYQVGFIQGEIMSQRDAQGCALISLA